MKLTGVHLLLTYQCNHQCDHCFTWGSPWQEGTMTLKDVNNILQQAEEAGTVEWIFFEGGEPFLYYTVLLRGVQAAAARGFKVGIVSNAYWATAKEDALEWLKPMAGLVGTIEISSDLYHWSEKISRQSQNASAAAEELGIPLGVITIAQPEKSDALAPVGKLPEGESTVRYRGRASEKLIEQTGRIRSEQCRECPSEDLREPGRIHVDPLGNIHVCQGLLIGNMFERPLGEICASYDPDAHPVVGPLLAGGPEELARRYDVPHAGSYADACHFCYEVRRSLRSRFPEYLGPDQMYGVIEEG
jgi:MoaA/NifB/PqqE/SkfB family radical SAM enzyme